MATSHRTLSALLRFCSRILLTNALVWSWLCVGVLTTAAGFGGWFAQGLELFLLVPAVLLIVLIARTFQQQQRWPRVERLFLLLVTGTWVLHALQVVVPETGFDALWYHLPVAQLVTQHRQFVYSPQLYQTVNPLFSDAIFFLGYLWQAEAGAKGVAYGFGLTLAVVTYSLARVLLSRRWALLCVFVVSGFQVVAWQSASFYIDVAKAVWELAAVFLGLQLLKQLRGAVRQSQQTVWQLASLIGLLLGASVASKLFSVVLVPGVLAVLLLSLPRNILGTKARLVYAAQILLAVVCSSLLVALPYYWHTRLATGNWLGLTSTHVDTLMLSSADSVPDYILERTRALPGLPVALVFNREYLTPLFALAIPLLALSFRAVWVTPGLRFLLGFSLLQIGVWWYIPPLSVRYALSGFVVFAVLVVWMIRHAARRFQWPERRVLLASAGVAAVVLLPRVGVLHRNLPYLSGNQTQSEYLEQFLDGNLDSVLSEWYELE